MGKIPLWVELLYQDKQECTRQAVVLDLSFLEHIYYMSSSTPS